MPDIPRIADVVVIGGGVVGCSVACAAAERGLHTVLCEALPMLGGGSTGASVGGIRQQFSEPHNILLTRQSLPEFLTFADRYGQEIDFVQNGYVLLATRPDTWTQLQRNVATQQSCGASTQLIDAHDARELVPGLETGDILGATFGPEDGFADPSGIAHGFAAGARRAGAQLLLETPVRGLTREGDRVTGVDTVRGHIACPAVVNVAGPSLAQVGRMTGVELPVQPTRRQVFVTTPTELLAREAPLTIDLDAPCYFRPESGGVLFSGAEEDPAAPGERPAVDWGTLEAVVARVMRRLPALADAEVRRGWAGLRTLTPDRTALLGPVRGLEGFYLAGGFSGHGVMHSPAVGRIIADLLCDGTTDRCDLSPFAPDRFTAPVVPTAPQAI